MDEIIDLIQSRIRASEKTHDAPNTKQDIRYDLKVRIDVYGEILSDIEELRESQKASTSDSALPISDVGDALAVEFANWIADQDLLRTVDGWEYHGMLVDIDTLHEDFLKQKKESEQWSQ